MRPLARRCAPFAAAAGLVAAALPIASVAAHTSHRSARHDVPKVSHVLLISVDGLHQSDLQWFAANHPGSALAQLMAHGLEYSNAHTSVPSDSDPGGTALMTGGDP